ncbi:MAG: OadG family protein [Clostridia bacterium]|nr:OadG family protein [Clostridia bacterium]
MEQIENVGKMILASDANALEKAIFGLKILLMGLGTVFSVLIFLWLVLTVFRVVFVKSNVAKPTKPQPAPKPMIAPTAKVVAEAAEDDTELIAVLMAAICAASGTSDPSKLRIVSYKRQKTPWNRK